MIASNCICSEKSVFYPFIEYKNETVFKNYEGILVGKCRSCGTLKTILPSKKIKNNTVSRPDMYEDNKMLFIDLFRNLASKIKRYKPEGKALDVGCSSGILLEVLKKENYDVWGIEPNITAFHKARKKFASRIFLGSLEKFNLKNKLRFDIIIYNHVLEHIENIGMEFALIKKVLKNNGLLVIGLPNTQNIIFWLRKKYWESLMPKEHIWHFSKKNIQDLLNKEKFKILDISFSNHDRKGYPLLKRVYFRILELINRVINTGEAMLLMCEYEGV